jgi:hypothetical protein
MAISSTTVSDTAAGTSTLTITSGVTVESVVYTISTRNLVFSTVGRFALSATDFIKFQTILDVYNAFLQNVFGATVLGYNTFSVAQVVDTNDGSSSLNYQFYNTNHPLYNITATYPNGTIAFGNRNQSTTLTYEEFVYFINSRAHFIQEVHNVYKI